MLQSSLLKCSCGTEGVQFGSGQFGVVLVPEMA